ncbi:MAG: bifunctional diaminohydroxyphosphoribosylaminopyrimidine deaminase/5-amino-6-(5-phosphoribosylamino)uracil reductase RibD [Gracilibacteraceae bacterium]|jgi:diaminohydroxyphosphoribosylaminopyrimidine deaminase/5-amino-6-(5-phosphoribosylamino)uracil reductase|nr:bifunctional diaminohydroxyphosphoribosylaminopyrimidine deaminase/5-amino-6-(5-phosphoribosylamino)uracil reductase RibD [Gracilibacteraceae bacterium]
MFSFHDTQYMQRALALAEQAAGRTTPNPLVGCVIVRDGHIVGEGYHEKVGSPHAEVNALNKAGDKARGADLYVTLEPCNHYGRTPPCTEHIITAGIRRVIAAMIDPNPHVRGQGLERLRQNGIDVASGLMEDPARILNQAYIKVIATGLPFITLKTAYSMDGKQHSASISDPWITSEQSRLHVHQLRNASDVILAGSQTVLKDDPQLTCRLPNIPDRNPVRIIVDGQFIIPITARICRNNKPPDAEWPDQVIIATTRQAWDNAPPAQRASFSGHNHITIWAYDSERYVPLSQLMHDIASHGWNNILLEGGEILANAMLQQRLIDKIEFHYAPKLYGHAELFKHQHPVMLENIEYSWDSGDLRILGYPKYNA